MGLSLAARPVPSMRVTFVLPAPDLSGGTRVVATYADQLARRGHQVTIAFPADPPMRLRQRVSWIRRTGSFRVLWRPVESHLDGLSTRLCALDPSRPATDSAVPDADVVIATWWKTAEWVAALSPSKGVKIHLVQGHEVHVPGQSGERVNSALRLPLRKLTTSRWLARTITEVTGWADVPVIPNSVDTDLFHAPKRGKQARPTLGFVYSGAYFKGSDIAFEVVEQLRVQLPRLRVVVFGAEPPTKTRPLPRGAEFHLRPRQTALRLLYGQCDVWLCPSRGEGYYLPMLEAMACRCPVVATRVGGSLEKVEDARNGYLVEVGDVRALADRSLRILTTSNDEWRALSDSAYATALRYSWDDATDLFEAELEHALARA
jgi:glycosyltransferase involved in cell wall biosynthesis